MTRKVKGLHTISPEVTAEIHPSDAEKNGIENESVVKVISRRGEIEVRVRITKRSPEGTIFIPFHFGEMAVNLLTNDALDPVSRIPELKVCAVSIEPL